MGSPSVWCPVRQAIEQYNSKIRREIERYLDHIKTDGSAFLIRLCMIGRKGEKPSPTIMIFSANRDLSKKLEASVRGSGILDRYPELQLSSCTIPLEPPAIPLKSERRARRQNTSTSIGAEPKASKTDTSDISGPRMGRKLELIVSSEQGLRVQHATGGLIVRIGDEMYQITSFGSEGATKEWNSVSDSPRGREDSEFDSHSEAEDSGYEQEFTSEKSLLVKKGRRRERRPYRHGQELLVSKEPYPCEAVCSPPPESDGGIATSLIWKEKDTSFTHTNRRKPIHTIRKDSHYTLVKLTDHESAEASNVVLRGEDHVPRGIDVVEIAKVGEEAVGVLVVTARGSVQGTVLPDIASVSLRGSAPSQTVHAIILSEPLYPADCGSAVIDTVTGSCYGHIALKAEGHVVAYMAPAADTMADIVRNFGQLPSLQLDRHINIKHSNTVERWKCVNPRSKTYRPLAPLGKCTSCSSGKLYSARSRAAAHLRRRHFPDESTFKSGNGQWKINASHSRPPATELKNWTKEISVTPLYARVMQAESDSDSDSDYGNDIGDTDDDVEEESPSTTPTTNVTDRQDILERGNEDLRGRNEMMRHEIAVLEGDVDVLMEDREELKQELEYLRRRLSERDAQLVEAQLDAMLHTGCARPKEAAVMD